MWPELDTIIQVHLFVNNIHTTALVFVVWKSFISIIYVSVGYKATGDYPVSSKMWKWNKIMKILLTIYLTRYPTYLREHEHFKKFFPVFSFPYFDHGQKLALMFFAKVYKR